MPNNSFHTWSRSLLTGVLATATTLAYGDNLLDVYQKAAQGDPQILTAAAAHRAALEARPQSRAALLPQVSATSNLTRNRQEIADSGTPADGSYFFNSHGFALNLTQSVYHHDAYVQLRQADNRITQADATYGAAEQDLIVRSATLYFDALAARDAQSFAHAERDSIARQLEQAKQRFEVGLIANTDVQEAQARYDLGVAQAITADNELDSKDEAVRELTGAEHGHLIGLGANLPLIAPEPKDMAQWVDTALKQNLQLSAAQAALHVAQEEVKRRRAGHLPSLDLVGSHAYQNIGGGAYFGARESRDSSVTLQLNLPLYSGGLIASRTREAVQLQLQSAEQLEQVRRATERQSRDAFRGVLTSISTVSALKQAVKSNQSALEAANAGNEVGTRTLIDVLDAQSNLFRAKRDYARTRYDYLLNTLRLKQAAGTLAPKDLAQVNSFLED